jgi:hypothetical protein
MKRLFLCALFAVSPAAAQLSNPGATSADIEAATAKAQAAQDAATAAMTAVDSKCIPLPAVPPAEMVNGAPGSGNYCQLSNAVPPRISRTDVFSTSGSLGMLTVTWDNPLPLASASGVPYKNYPVQLMPVAVVGAAPAKWKVISSTNTGFTAQCSQDKSTLDFTLSQLTNAAVTGLQIPVNSWCPAGTIVMALQSPAAK